jgi:undecaprenyl diphosphate synthase
MDGNGRWAQAKNLPRLAGHEMGAKALIKAIEELNKLDIECASFYAFSTENEKRNSEEVSNILGVIAYFLQNDISKLIEKSNLQVRIIGDIARLPQKLSDIICEINSRCLNNKGMKVILAIAYGGDVEVCNAFDTLIKRRKFLKIEKPITKEELFGALYTANMPNPDLVIRYGGYQRLSNFMPLQTAYSELFFTETFWPDFNITEVNTIIENFNLIKRNFGGLNG